MTDRNSNACERIKLTVIIGSSRAARTFTKYAVQGTITVLDADENMKGTKPIILPLTNPSQLVAVTPSGLMARTDERYWRTSLLMTNEF